MERVGIVNRPFEDRLMRYITVERGISNTSKIAELVGDFFEFFAFYLIAQAHADLLAAMILDNVRVGAGAETVEKALNWRPQPAHEWIYIMATDDCQVNQPSPSCVRGVVTPDH